MAIVEDVLSIRFADMKASLSTMQLALDVHRFKLGSFGMTRRLSCSYLLARSSCVLLLAIGHRRQLCRIFPPTRKLDIDEDVLVEYAIGSEEHWRQHLCKISA